MSAFLGPIHFWLYRKIELQEALSDVLANKAAENGVCFSGAQEVAAALPPLEKVIDESNIHGWLQERIFRAEQRYAEIVGSVLADAPQLWPLLLEEAERFGRRHAFEENLTAPAAFQSLEGFFLNGMPCDHTNLVVEQDERRVLWQQTKDLHGVFWQDVDGKERRYEALRLRVMAGLLSRSGFTVKRQSSGACELSVEKKGESDDV
ncbi:MAG: hypothetical protein SOR89_05830 [Ndongobacter sp.]|nr:hypothetical protein [Ndongobacter sp.]